MQKVKRKRQQTTWTKKLINKAKVNKTEKDKNESGERGQPLSKIKQHCPKPWGHLHGQRVGHVTHHAST